MIGYAADSGRVEKYRPDTIEDVSGHQDILATINRFVECNVRFFLPDIQAFILRLSATATSTPLRAPRNRQNIHDPSPCETDIRDQEHATDGAGTQCQ